MVASPTEQAVKAVAANAATTAKLKANTLFFMAFP
jgi:hypothetical protein